MTTATDLKAITPTANAKSTAASAGHNVTTLLQTAQLQAAELKATLKLLISVTPNGDANLTALNNILTAVL